MFYPIMPIYPIFPKLPCDCDLPPTIYALLNSYVNYGKTTQTKIKNLASEGRSCIFDFDYPLSNNVTKASFETLILNHYMQRRIGFDTPTAFKIALCSKLNEIMPMYNKILDAIQGWDIFTDTETITRNKTDEGENTMSNSATASSSNVSDRRYSKMPQNQLSDIQNGTHMTDYNYDTDTSTSTSGASANATNSNETNETITKTFADKMKNYKEFIQNRESVYSMIFKELDDLFYGLMY